MPVQTSCPHCSTACLVGEQHLGQVIRCFACKQVFRLQGPGPKRNTAMSLAGDAEANLPMPTFDVEPAQPAALCVLDIGAATTPGKLRDHNEDAYLIRRQTWHSAASHMDVALLAVADGMGGYGGGEQASALTIQALQASLSTWFDAALQGQAAMEQTAGARLRAGLNVASQAVHTAAADPQLKGMGAAAVAALIWDNQVVLAHVGDCRAYHWREGVLVQLTKDQTLVQRMLDLGTLSPREAQHHPAKNELSQAIGRRPDVACDLRQLTLERGDWLVLACDGLHAHLSHGDLGKELERSQPSAHFLSSHLIEVVNQRGGSDNCTVIAVHCL